MPVMKRRLQTAGIQPLDGFDHKSLKDREQDKTPLYGFATEVPTISEQWGQMVRPE